jgi:cytochrome b pre-mRNA-processing protein 3
MGIWPFRRSRADQDGELLLSTVVQIARQPSFYGEGRAPDTLEGRLELMIVHAVMALLRLKAEGGLAPLAQAFTDKLFRSFDAGLREDGVGDLTVPKKMRKLASEFYGRLGAYTEAIEAGDAGQLAAALVRNGAAGEAFGANLAAYVQSGVAAQTERPAADMMRLDGWPPAPN